MHKYESYAEYYHELTKYTPEGISKNKHVLDFNNQPKLFKTYPQNLKKVDLSYLLPLDRNPFSDTGIKSPDEYTEHDKYLSKISKILYLANGITSIGHTGEQRIYMRSAPSAGGLYPTEIYLLVYDHPVLDDGIYHYHSLNHSITNIKQGNFKNTLLESTFNHDAVSKNNIFLILTAIFFRSSWRYQDRAYRRICLDTGHIIGNIDVASNYCGFKPYLIGGFIDEKINTLLDLNADEEQALTIISLSDKEHKTEINSSSVLPSPLKSDNANTPEGYRIIELHKRSHISEKIKIPNLPEGNLEEKFIFSPSISLGTDKNQTSWKTKLIETMLYRRSTREFSGEPLSKEELASIMDFAYHPEFFSHEPLDTNPSYFDLSPLETFIAINSVTGLEEGCYYYSAKNRYLKQVRFKNFREDILYLCLGQELGYKASAVIFHTCDLSKYIYKYGERIYRYIHLDAGHIGERINLACINLGLGVSGIGGFFDDQVNDLLGIPEKEAVVYITTIGVPEKIHLN